MPKKRKRDDSHLKTNGTSPVAWNQALSFCSGCRSKALPAIQGLFSHAPRLHRTKVGNILDAVENEQSCLLCRFFVDTLQLRTKDGSYRIRNVVTEETAIFFATDPEPWFVKAGVSANVASCPYAWLQIGPATEEPLVCLSFEPVVPDGTGTKPQPDRIYPRRRHLIDAYNGVCDIELVDSWLRKCEEQHEECTQGEGKLPDNFMLIDVDTRRLVRHQPGYTFLTLSYVWGKGALQQRYWFDMTSELAITYEADSRIPALLPQTMEDAMQIVRKLGKRYLWVDLLCINQANELEKQEQIEAMDTIFASSWLTLVSVDGPGADHGLAGVSRNMLHTRQPTVLTPIGRLTATYVHAQWEHNGESAWDGRAWTLQERLLSRRCLFFADTYLSMLCREEIFHELIDINTKSPDVVLYQDNSFFREDGSSIYLDDEQWNFDTYANLVSVFTGRAITDQNDILNACRGSLKRMTSRTNHTFHFGLPKADLLQALLWIPHYQHQLVRRPGFPSWSWLGWIGRSEYPYWLHFQNQGEAPSISASQERRLQVDRAKFEQRNNGRLSATVVHDATMTAPVIQLATTIRPFSARLLVRHGEEFSPSPIRHSRTAIGDQWTLLKHHHHHNNKSAADSSGSTGNGSLLVNTVGEMQRFGSTQVWFRLHADQSREVGWLKDRVELVFVRYWSRMWDTRDVLFGHMVSCLVVRRDKEGCYHRLGCVVLSADDWLAGAGAGVSPVREVTITLV